MDERVYDKLRVIELDFRSHYSPLNRSIQTPKIQQKDSIVKKLTAKRCVVLWFGTLIGSVVSGVLVFLVLQYRVWLSYKGSSDRTELTSLRGCNSPISDFAGICFDRKLDIKFDPTTLFSTCFLSDDLTTLSNRYTDRTPYNPKAGSRFQNYRGAMVNTCVENSIIIYYEINFHYVITATLPHEWLVLELGIGNRYKIDNYYYVGSGWSFHLQNCLEYNQVCLNAEYHPRGIHEVIKPFSNNTAGTSVNGTFGILIDREQNTFSLFYNDTILFIFHDVLSNVSLCPVFGVYNPGQVQVDLRIVFVGKRH